ncbi:DUF2235 domain-containing protein (plasmid) [Cereibacter azotoformans]|uniref:Putative alpha/beta hydrolase family protein DUF2235 n=1 Tax=Cereibacter azotoformans TaxID=43057 RepID=A0A2T5JYW4_9RHOB|nr:DUF2235 domain-containing protein [Cereibacter azotoformans]AXQ94501.1 DUF2235 domain-containing protein [Cereibacter sphaeroides]MBO4170662.1 DUF2235 domain-containing protein [Cereibacter azotoformans]PTR15336.1 putative alpha/beta hydrolase family protein DUF2235 [Cereibacter azotoformans]UIJ30052.1 DUF2235 domain-containing protein [Cereibacter azotoformans]ULB12727.1 DUF2235 domain-containing protein [Cereibacter azotoformans]
MSLIKSIRHWLRTHPTVTTEPATPPGRGARRGPVDHVILLDGTCSSLEPGHETNVGLIFKLLRQGRRSVHRTIYYEPGLQWCGWLRIGDLVQGRGLNRQIRRAYGYLASHYQPGDRIFLFGYSRGAYAVRSLAGVIDRVGLLRREEATERNVQLAWRHYEQGSIRPHARAFSRRYCHPRVEIEVVGIFDTVKALGLRLPLLWRLTEDRHAFHSHRLGRTVRHGFHALAMDETRTVFEPVLWDYPYHGQIVEQAWFRGGHGDIGGQLNGGRHGSRLLSNIPLVWMLERAAHCGLQLPESWRAEFPCDASAPMTSLYAGWGKLFLWRQRRSQLCCPTEYLHPTALRPDCAPRKWRLRLGPAEAGEPTQG